MNVRLSTDIVIKCTGDECGRSLTIPQEALSYYTEAQDRGKYGMGVETLHCFEINFACDCGNWISIVIRGFEYPMGNLYYEDKFIEGGIFENEKELHVELVWYAEEFNEDVSDSYLSWIESELLEYIVENPDHINNCSGIQFEEIVEQVLKKYGFKTKLTPKSRDGGRDIIATISLLGAPLVFYVECKHWKRTVGVKVVRELLGVITSERVNKGILVTSGRVSPDAREFAKKQNVMIDIKTFKELIEMIRRNEGLNPNY